MEDDRVNIEQKLAFFRLRGSGIILFEEKLVNHLETDSLTRGVLFLLNIVTNKCVLDCFLKEDIRQMVPFVAK